MSAAPRAAIASLPDGPGVYRFRDARGRALYIGRAVDLRRRVGSYWADLGDRPHLTRMVPQIVRVEAVACDSAHEAAWLERNLLERSKPRWNRVPGGQEVPVCIRVDRRAGSMRLAVAHWPLRLPSPRTDPVAVFGPYLGGTRARLAVSALDRVLPLAYAGDRLTGSERDLARVRGVAAPDRAALLTTVTAVLHRQPAAVESVREQLERQRDRASARLAYELAARIQQEIEAVEWILAAQHVTQLSAPPAPLDLFGWADGLLVHFEIRHGRVCAWRQRGCPYSAARAYLDQTPADWREFVDRNAGLARQLADAQAGAA